MKRKILSLALVLMMVISMIPMGAFAATSTTVTMTSGGTFQANTTQTLTFTFDNTGGTVVPASGFFKLTFPAGTDLSAVTLADVTLGGAKVAGLTKAAVTVDSTNSNVLWVQVTASAQTGVGGLTVAVAKVGLPVTTPNAAFAVGTYATQAGAVIDAFTGTQSIVSGSANLYTSVVSADKTSVTADGQSTAKVTAYIYDVNHNLVADGTKVYIDTNRGSADAFTADKVTISGTDYNVITAATADAPRYITTANGKVEFKVKSSVAGTAKIGLAIDGVTPIWNAANGKGLYLQNYLAGSADSSINISTLGIVGGSSGPVDVKFQSDSANSIKVFSAANYDVKDVSLGATNPMANNLQYWEVQFKVTSTGNVPVAGKKVTFSSNDSAVTFSDTEKTTDAAGMVKTKVYSTKSGSFEVSASVDGSSANPAKTDGVQLMTNGAVAAKLVFIASDPTNLEIDDTQNQMLAKDRSGLDFDVKVFDSVGNALDLSKATNVDTMLDASVVKQPDGSDINVIIEKNGDTNGDALIQVTSALAKEGAYTIRASLKNGKRADLNFTVKEQGKITDLSVAYDETFIQQNDALKTNKPAVKRVDANGVKTGKLTPSSNNITVTSSDTSLITVDKDGLATVVTKEKEDIGKTVTITFIDKNNNLSKSVDLKIAGKIASVKAVAPTAAAVGKDAVVTVNSVDSKGNITAGMNKDNGAITTQVIILEKPAGATVGSTESSSFSGDMHDTGAATIKFTSNVAGNVKARIIVTDNPKAPTVQQSYSTDVTMTFGAAAPSATAKNIILTIGSTTAVANNAVTTLDVAPFIKDGRAFVPVSFVTAQLGGKAEFTKKADGTVDTVTVTVGTSVATIKIGETAIKVVKDGKETTVTSDAAAFIKGGRTVLPFRAISDAIGATATYGMKADNSGVEWVKFAQ